MAINLHATTTIDVHDQNFRQFVQNFNQFQQNLNRVPGQWNNIQRQSIMATVQMQQATQAMMQNVNAATSRLGTFSSNLQKVGHQFRTGLVNPMQNFFAKVGNMMWSGGGSPSTVGGGAVARQQAVAAGGGGAAAAGGVPAGAPGPRGTFGRGAFAVGGTSRLLRRFGVGSFITGLLGGGGLYGMSALASGAQNARQSYLGMGTDYGTMKSYDLAYAGLFSGKEYLANIARAQGLPTSPQAQALWSLEGIDPQKKQSPGALAQQTLMKIRSDTKGMDPFNLGLYYQGHQLQGMFNFEDVRRISSISDKEFTDRYTKQAQDAEKLNIVDDSVKSWADLNQSLKTSGEIMKKGFIEGLEGSTTGLGHFSTALATAFAKIISSNFMKGAAKGIGGALDNFASWLDSINNGTFWKKFGEERKLRSKEWEEQSKTHPELRWIDQQLDNFKRWFGVGKQTNADLQKKGAYSFGQMMGDTRVIGGGIGNAISNVGSFLNRNVVDPIRNFGKNPGFNIATPNLAQSDTNILKTLMGVEAGPLGYYDRGKVTPSGDRAYGMYQVMGNNIRSWTKKWLGTELGPMEFLNNPQAQDTVALGQFKEYMQQHGGSVVDALAMWKSGQPYAASQNWADPTAGDNVRSYVKKGVGIYNAQPGVSKVDINVYQNAGSSVSTNAGTTAVPPGITVNAY